MPDDPTTKPATPGNAELVNELLDVLDHLRAVDSVRGPYPFPLPANNVHLFGLLDRAAAALEAPALPPTVAAVVEAAEAHILAFDKPLGGFVYLSPTRDALRAAVAAHRAAKKGSEE